MTDNIYFETRTIPLYKQKQIYENFFATLTELQAALNNAKNYKDIIKYLAIKLEVYYGIIENELPDDTCEKVEDILWNKAR